MRITKNQIDYLAALDAEITQLTAERKRIAAALKEDGRSVFQGHYYVAEVSRSNATSLDAKAVKALLTPAEISQCSKTTERCTIRTKQLEAYRAAA